MQCQTCTSDPRACARHPAPRECARHPARRPIQMHLALREVAVVVGGRRRGAAADADLLHALVERRQLVHQVLADELRVARLLWGSRNECAWQGVRSPRNRGSIAQRPKTAANVSLANCASNSAPHLEEAVLQQLSRRGAQRGVLLQAARHDVAHVLWETIWGEGKRGDAGQWHCKCITAYAPAAGRACRGVSLRGQVTSGAQGTAQLPAAAAHLAEVALPALVLQARRRVLQRHQ